MRCQAITILNDGTICPCQQTLQDTSTNLCHYHGKMKAGLITPGHRLNGSGWGSPVFRVETKEGACLYKTGRHTASQTSSGSMNFTTS